MAPKDNKALILGVVTVVAASVICYYYYISQDSKTGDKKKKKSSETQKVKDVPSVQIDTIEEDDDDAEEVIEGEEEEEEEITEEEKIAEELTPPIQDIQRELYDAANRLASKYISGQSYKKAAEKLTEAVDLAKLIPSASKDILTLYNNRSAMYEKMGEYDKSLNDINFVLEMDTFHIKARVRRARVYEAQKKEQQSLDDYVYAMFLERIKGDNSTNDKKIEVLYKSLGSKKATLVLSEIRSTDKSLPSTTYCRTFLENFPSVHQWKVQYGVVLNSGSTQRSASEVEAIRGKLVEAVDTVEEGALPETKLRAVLALVCMDIASESFSSAFSVLSTVSEFAEVDRKSASPELKKQLILLHELLGTGQHLKCNLNAAIESYETTLGMDPTNLGTSLKLASVYLDLGEKTKAEEIYTKLIKEKESKSELEQAWVLIHSSSLWLTRDQMFAYPPNAVENAITAIDAALELSKENEEGGDSEETKAMQKAARFLGLLKAVHILSAVKAQLGETSTPEETKRTRESVQEAKKLFPNKLSVLLLEADHLQMDGDVESSLRLLEDAVGVANSCNMDGAIVDVTLIKASALTSQAFSILSNPNSPESEILKAQKSFQEVEKLYSDALTLDPNSIEVMAQYAQLKSMILGDFEGAVKLLQTALPLARTSDEVQELCQLLVMNEAQAKTAKELQQTVPQ